MEILDLVEKEDVEFIRLQFTDMFGNLKNVAVTASQLDRVLENQYVFEGTAIFDDQKTCEEDYYLYPDFDTFVVLPWRPQQGKVARLLCDVYDEQGKICELSPRTILKRTLQKASEKGYEFVIDPECEFFLFQSDEDGKPTTISHEDAGYLAVGPIDLGENARRDMVLSLEEMGFEIESSLHEKAPAQHEIVFRGADALTIADSIITFRSAVKSIARRFGLHASFMPKPKKGVAGSGMHIHINAKRNGKDVFIGSESEYSEDALAFMGGIISHVKGICAVTNPLVNSYKRICSGFEAPKEINWSVKNKNTLLRLKNKTGQNSGIELRFPDSAANPYLTLALCIEAGLEGIEKKTSAIEYLIDTGVKETSKKNKVDYLPATLREAVIYMSKDELVKETLGKKFTADYIEVKDAEWNEFMEEVSDWEVVKYLNRI